MQPRALEQRYWCAFVLLALLTGCESTGKATRLTQQLDLVISPCNGLDISARLMELEGDLHIHGSVRTRSSGAAPSGHLDILVRTPEGALWASVEEQYRPKLRNRPRGGPGHATFDIILDGKPPTGSTVTVQHHDSSHAEQ